MAFVLFAAGCTFNVCGYSLVKSGRESGYWLIAAGAIMCWEAGELFAS